MFILKAVLQNGYLQSLPHTIKARCFQSCLPSWREFLSQYSELNSHQTLSAGSTQKRNAPVWKRLGVKLLLIECWASLYDSWCIFIKYRPNPTSIRTARQAFLYISSKYSVCWNTQRIRSPKFLQPHKQKRDELKAADWLCNRFLEVLLKVFLRSLKRKKMH